MRFIVSMAFAYLVLLGPAVLAQQKNELDGYDEGEIDFINGMAKIYNDKRTLEQIWKDNALIRAAEAGDVKAVRKALKAGALINSYYLDGCAAFGSDGSGYTALMSATWQGKWNSRARRAVATSIGVGPPRLSTSHSAISRRVQYLRGDGGGGTSEGGASPSISKMHKPGKLFLGVCAPE